MHNWREQWPRVRRILLIVWSVLILGVTLYFAINYRTQLLYAIFCAVFLAFPTVFYWLVRPDKPRKARGRHPRWDRFKSLAARTLLIAGAAAALFQLAGAIDIPRLAGDADLQRPAVLLVTNIGVRRDVLHGGPVREVSPVVIDDPEAIDCIYRDLESWPFNRYAQPHIPTWQKLFVVTAFATYEEWESAQARIAATEPRPSGDKWQLAGVVYDPYQTYSAESVAMYFYEPEPNSWPESSVCRFSFSSGRKTQIFDTDSPVPDQPYIAGHLSRKSYALLTGAAQ